MKITKLQCTALAVATLGFAPITAAYAEQAFTFTGLIDTANGFSNVKVGDTFTAVFTLSDHAFNYLQDPYHASYVSLPWYRPGDVTAVETFGGYTVIQDFSDPFAYNILNGEQTDPSVFGIDSIGAGTQGTSGDGITEGYSNLDVFTSDPSTLGALSSIYPVISGPGLNDISYWQSTYFGFSGQNADGSSGSISGHLTDIHTVTSTPEPAPMAVLWLGGIGLCALVLRARKRQSATV
ncbi:MAG: hypothetical protein ABIY70_02330 [Capsulimonas sp.]